MKKLIFFIIFILCVVGYGQSANDYFVQSANQYVNSQLDKALEIVDEGLSKFPNNPKLEALKKKIEEQEKQNSDGSDKEDKKSDEGENQNQDKNQSQQKSNQNDGRNNGDKGSGNSDENSQNKDNGGGEGNPNNGDNFQENRYNNILKSLKKQEQNTQRRLMMGKNKAKLGRKQKDW